MSVCYINRHDLTHPSIQQSTTPSTPRTPSTQSLPLYPVFPPSAPASPPSSSFAISHTSSQPHYVPLPSKRNAAAKNRSLSKDLTPLSTFTYNPQVSPFPLSLPLTTHEPPSVAVVQPTSLSFSMLPESVVSHGTASKRRHSAMFNSSDSGGVSDIAPSMTASTSSSRRRTTRGGRGALVSGGGHLREVQNHQNQGFALDTMMDVEDEGRERKRVTRR